MIHILSEKGRRSFYEAQPRGYKAESTGDLSSEMEMLT